MQAMPPRALANGHWIKPGRLDQDVPRLVRNHGVESAHHAGQRNRFSGVGDDQVFRRQPAVNPIECSEGFSGLCPAHKDFSAFEQIEIKGMGRMPHFPQRVVGCVSRIVDGTLVYVQQTSRDRVRGCLDLDASQNPRRVARTVLLAGNLDREISVATRWRQRWLDRSKGKVVERRNLAGHSVVVHGIRTIGRDLHFEDGVFALTADRFHGDPCQGQVVRELVVVDREVNEITQPCGRNLHRSVSNCSIILRRVRPYSGCDISGPFCHHRFDPPEHLRISWPPRRKAGSRLNGIAPRTSHRR